jgi:hypothetical protein
VTQVYQNGVLIGTAFDGASTPLYTRIPTTLLPGLNTFQFVSENTTPGSAGLIVSIVTNPGGAVVAHTDGTWTWTA